MPSLTLKNIPNELMDELREAAEQERRSITQQVLYMLEQATARRETAKRESEHELKPANGPETT